MKWSLSFLVLSIFASVLIYKRGARNNVCKTFADYYSDRDSNPDCYFNPDHELDVPTIVQRHGYNVDTHQVVTDDGYILTLFRIFNGTKNKSSKPVLLSHGVTLNSGAFVLRGNRSLSLMLVNAGYDVWLGNFRGNRYSNNHTQMSNNDPKYWNFSFHEMGVYDMKSKFDYITNLTKQKVTHIGYSLGALAAIIYGSTYPEDAEKHIDLNIALAGCVSFNNVFIFQLMKYVTEHFMPVLQYFINWNFYPRPPIPLFLYLCYPYPFQINVCQLPDMMLLGFNYEENDPENLPVTFQHNVDVINVKTAIHMFQLTDVNKPYYYNYGEQENVRFYGSQVPPHYDLSKIRFDNLIFYAENDRLVTSDNVKLMYELLPNQTYLKELYRIKNNNYNHFDYINGKTADHYVYKPIIQYMKKREQKEN